MTDRKIYLWVQALLCILLAVLLAAGVIGIYQAGIARRADHPLDPVFTPQIVSEALSRVAPLFFAALGTAFAGLLLGVRDENAEKPVRDPALERDLIVSRVASPGGEMAREHSRQRRIRLAGWGSFGLCMIPVLIHLLQADHFPAADPEGMIASLALGTFPWIAAGIGGLMAAGVLEEKSVIRETEAARRQLQTEKAEGTRPSVPVKEDHTKKKEILQIVMLLLAAAFIVTGILNGSMRDVLIKAINICTECIGLG